MMPGVVVHANIISQILSASIDGRPLLRSWSEPMEWLIIIALASLGAVFSWWFRSTFAIACGLLAISCGLLGGCYLAFLYRWWLPLVPSLMALFGTTVVILMVTLNQRDRLQFQLTLDLLLKVYQDSPAIGRIAIEYLKQSENKKNQAFIKKKLL